MHPETPRWTLRSYAELCTDELYRILAARMAVFVVEQNCPYQDVDGRDAACLHLWTADDQGELLAYARLLPPGLAHAEASIGRVLTTQAGRALGLGRELMRQAIAAARLQWPTAALRIDAQQYLERFYASFGFVTASEVFDLDGIPHIEMVLAHGG